MEFPLEGSEPRVDGGRDHCCRMAVSPAGSSSLPSPWADEAVVAQERQQHPHISLLCSVAQIPEVHQLPAFCLLPCWLQPPRAWAGLQAAFSAPRPLPGSQWAQSPRASTNVLWPLTPRSTSLLLKHRNNKASPTFRAMARRQDRFPPAAGTKGALRHIPDLSDHTQVQLLGEVLTWGGIWGLADACCWEHNSIVQRVGQGVRALHHPAQLCITSLFSGWEANKG